MTAEYESHARALSNVLSAARGEEEHARVRAIFDEARAVAPGEPGGPALDGWIPLATNLAVLREIARQLGDDALARIGRSVPEHAAFPPHVEDVPSALASLDVAFHMNHRKRGAVMYDSASRQMREGIGHYHALPVGPRRALLAVTAVYPCAFDLGIAEGLARRFQPSARVAHVDPALCRERGEPLCLYAVAW